MDIDGHGIVGETWKEKRICIFLNIEINESEHATSKQKFKKMVNSISVQRKLN